MPESRGNTIRKLLIANRGEIAVRIAQTCRELDIRTVAVYSDADAQALHVQVADEAVRIGPATALESYLRIDAILAAARETGADAVHPGYGFLAENAEFAESVAIAGLTWIGPPASVIAALGDKVAAKRLAHSAGVPVVPGYAGDDQSLERLVVEADRIGYPVMVKAAAGGGGRGMRAVSHADDLVSAVEGAQREARSAFGNDKVFLEKLLLRPRHIEIQVVVDDYGHGIYLGERDCSLQRRHQKVVEEAPAPVLTPALRIRMGSDAVRLARASGYVNAGTVEFLFAGDSYYFLEMNTRIQVEHPVTEMTTGQDLVALQLQIASGQRLLLAQSDVAARGHAIEARIYAEDAHHGFVPATGTVASLIPPQGPGIRNDLGVYAGAEVTPYYDAMLAKLIVHAPTRTQAIHRLQGALEDYRVSGTVTNLGFLRWISRQPDVVGGRVDTGFLEREWSPMVDRSTPAGALAVAAAFEMTNPGSVSLSDPWRRSDSWRASGSRRQFTYAGPGGTHRVSLAGAAPTWSAVTDDGAVPLAVQLGLNGAFTVVEDDEPTQYMASAIGEQIRVEWEGGSVQLWHRDDNVGVESTSSASSDGALMAPMPGTVVKVAVVEHQSVAAFQPLVVLEAMKMEHIIEAPFAGTIGAILVQVGDLVPAGTPVVRMEPS